MLVALVRQRLPFLNKMFNALPDKRNPDDCLYTPATILWFVVLGFLCRKGTRNAMDGDRNRGMAPVNLLRVSEQNRWATERHVTAPSTQTATRFLDILKPRCLEKILVEVAHALIRS
jgi:hypothetical protein